MRKFEKIKKEPAPTNSFLNLYLNNLILMTNAPNATELSVKKEPPTLKSFMAQSEITKKMTEVLGTNSQSFVTTVLQIVASNDLLKKASFQSIYGAALTAATMKLPINPNLGFAYIVPYMNKKQDAKLNFKSDGKDLFNWLKEAENSEV